MAHHSKDKIWNDFVHWCKKRHLRPLPAHPWTIAAFLRWMDSQDEGENAEAALKSISRAHLINGRRSPHHHPMIERTMGSIYRRKKSAPDRSNLFEAQDFLTTAKTATTSPEPSDHDEDEHAPPTPRRQAMRSQPRLVSRRRTLSA